MFTTARRRAVDLARRRTRESRLGWRAASWVSDVAPDCAEAVLDAVSTEQAIGLVRRLPPLQAEVVLLRVVAGLSVAEVAQTVGRSPGAVRVAAHRGLKAMSELARGAVTLDDRQTLREVT